MIKFTEKNRYVGKAVKFWEKDGFEDHIFKTGVVCDFWENPYAEVVYCGGNELKFIDSSQIVDFSDVKGAELIYLLKGWKLVQQYRDNEGKKLKK